MTVTRFKATPERLTTFSDGVFAVLITVLVLDLRPPQLHTFDALLQLWPTWLSYALHFAHLFSVSLLPLSTAWMAESELAPQPVAFYAAVFFLVNVTYMLLIWDLVDRATIGEVSPTARRIMRARSMVTLVLSASPHS
jgi:uncharacterized membrane protein